jgi:hypothetical protein
VLCQHCHRHKLHKRFSRPHAWRAYLVHVRRGGYARDLALPDVKREVARLTRAIAAGESPFDLRPLRPYAQTPGHEWFADLSCDPLTLNSAPARPRP